MQSVEPSPTMSRPIVLLFDVDDTLISTGGAGRRALVAALQATQGDGEWLSFRLDGRTDRSIVRAALRERGRPDDESAIDAVIDAYLARLVEEVAAAPVYSVHPGVTELLQEASRPGRGCAVGLGTGNVERGAAIKLGRVGLNGYFGFGGFGNDHEDRAEILRAGARRGAARLRASLENCRVVVIGDTPRDVAAALAIGAECVGVATGNYSIEELRAAGAIAAFADLSQAGASEACLGLDP